MKEKSMKDESAFNFGKPNAMAGIPNEHLVAPIDLFSTQTDIVLTKLKQWVEDGRMTSDDESAFGDLLHRLRKEIIGHPIVSNNIYLKRFAEGVTYAQAQHEIQQFSIFAHRFDIAQGQLVVEAPTREAYRERLKILLNEKGCAYKHGFEGDLAGTWNEKHVHFVWLLNMAQGLGLDFTQVGKIAFATEGTKAFVEATFKYYTSPDPNVQAGASMAIENWAAHYLWTPWLSGMRKLNASLPVKVNLGYLTYHEQEEQHHSQATIDELLENFLQDWFDADTFIQGATAILNEGVLPYYVSQLATLPEKEGTDWPTTWPLNELENAGISVQGLSSLNISGVEDVENTTTH
jgi:hypothetical protein